MIIEHVPSGKGHWPAMPLENSDRIQRWLDLMQFQVSTQSGGLPPSPSAESPRSAAGLGSFTGADPSNHSDWVGKRVGSI